MIELNKKYSLEQLAKAMGISYNSIKHDRKKYENHLSLFYDYDITTQGRGIYYIFLEQYSPYIPYKEFSKNKRNALFQEKIKATIIQDNRQTGSNIARIICIEDDVQVLDLKLSTITVYTRSNLKELLNQGYYELEDYRWCYLDKEANKYVVMLDSQIKELRSYFSDYHNLNKEEQEDIYSQIQQGLISKQEGQARLGENICNGFTYGIKMFEVKYNMHPIKVPVYVRAVKFNDDDILQDAIEEDPGLGQEEVDD